MFTCSGFHFLSLTLAVLPLLIVLQELQQKEQQWRTRCEELQVQVQQLQEDRQELQSRLKGSHAQEGASHAAGCKFTRTSCHSNVDLNHVGEAPHIVFMSHITPKQSCDPLDSLSVPCNYIFDEMLFPIHYPCLYLQDNKPMPGFGSAWSLFFFTPSE